MVGEGQLVLVERAHTTAAQQARQLAAKAGQGLGGLQHFGAGMQVSQSIYHMQSCWANALTIAMKEIVSSKQERNCEPP